MAGWSIALPVVKRDVAKLWQVMGEARTMPRQFTITHMCFIPKPGKDASQAQNCRGLHLTDAGEQIFYKYLQPVIKSDMYDEWGSQAFGGIQRRSTLHAIATVFELFARARQSK